MQRGEKGALHRAAWAGAWRWEGARHEGGRGRRGGESRRARQAALRTLVSTPRVDELHARVCSRSEWSLGEGRSLGRLTSAVLRALLAVGGGAGVWSEPCPEPIVLSPGALAGGPHVSGKAQGDRTAGAAAAAAGAGAAAAPGETGAGTAAPADPGEQEVLGGAFTCSICLWALAGQTQGLRLLAPRCPACVITLKPCNRPLRALILPILLMAKLRHGKVTLHAHL